MQSMQRWHCCAYVSSCDLNNCNWQKGFGFSGQYQETQSTSKWKHWNKKIQTKSIENQIKNKNSIAASQEKMEEKQEQIEFQTDALKTEIKKTQSYTKARKQENEILKSLYGKKSLPTWSNRTFTDDVMLCVVQLVSLQVAAEKVTPVI